MSKLKSLMLAMEHEHQCWLAYEKAGIGKITARMVIDRQDAKEKVDRMLRDIASELWSVWRLYAKD